MTVATISTSGTQFRVRQGDVLTVDRIHSEPGSKLKFDKVLMIEQDDNISAGSPHVADAMVEAEVLEHFRGKKIRIIKLRRRKNSRRTRGHRSELSKIRITAITVK